MHTVATGAQHMLGHKACKAVEKKQQQKLLAFPVVILVLHTNLPRRSGVAATAVKSRARAYTFMVACLSCDLYCWDCHTSYERDFPLTYVFTCVSP